MRVCVMAQAEAVYPLACTARVFNVLKIISFKETNLVCNYLKTICNGLLTLRIFKTLLVVTFTRTFFKAGK